MHASVSKSRFDQSVGRWPPDLAKVNGWILHKVEYPVVDCEFTAPGRTPLRVYMNCADWDERPPSVTLQNSQGEPLKTLPENRNGIFNPGPHRNTGLPFVCMAGTLEFHTHESHLNEKWDINMPDFNIGDILVKIWRGWLKGSG